VVVKLGTCPKCGDPILPHTVCSTCGYYKDREIIHLETKLEKKLRKDKNKKEEEE
jgi:large subunit ribosomal protein L32